MQDFFLFLYDETISIDTPSSIYPDNIKKVLLVGDSTIAAYGCRSERISDIFFTSTETSNGFVAANIAVPGHTFEMQLTSWNNYTSKTVSDVIIIQLGLNNCNPNTYTTTTNRGHFLNLINAIKLGKRADAKIMLSCMLPCKSRWAALGWNTDNAQILWNSINNDIMNDYYTAIDFKNNSHVAILDDGLGNLKAEYNCGDNIHENLAGAIVIKNAMRNSLGFL